VLKYLPLYGYVLNNPINFIDPSGKFSIVGAIVGIAVVAAIGHLVHDFFTKSIEAMEALEKPYKDAVEALNDPNAPPPDPNDLQKGIEKVGEALESGSNLNDAMSIGHGLGKACP
jgi:hypothetical protein